MGNAVSYAENLQESTTDILHDSNNETVQNANNILNVSDNNNETVQNVRNILNVSDNNISQIPVNISSPITQSELTPIIQPITISKNIRKQPFVHPFIDMIYKDYSEEKMINMLQAFCGRIEIERDQYDRPIYEIVDQTEFIAPVLQVFSHCANNGKKEVVQWLVDNFVPLQVSYDNNYCFFECLKWKNYEIVDIIVDHESFYPSMEVLENLISRSKYAQIKKCMTSPYLQDDFGKYRFTIMHYVDNNQFVDINNLFMKIKQKLNNQQITIDDIVYPNPRLPKISSDVYLTTLTSVDPIIDTSTTITTTIEDYANPESILIEVDSTNQVDTLVDTLVEESTETFDKASTETLMIDKECHFTNNSNNSFNSDTKSVDKIEVVIAS